MIIIFEVPNINFTDVKILYIGLKVQWLYLDSGFYPGSTPSQGVGEYGTP